MKSHLEFEKRYIRLFYDCYTNIGRLNLRTIPSLVVGYHLGTKCNSNTSHICQFSSGGERAVLPFVYRFYFAFDSGNNKNPGSATLRHTIWWFLIKNSRFDWKSLFRPLDTRVYMLPGLSVVYDLKSRLSQLTSVHLQYPTVLVVYI